MKIALLFRWPVRPDVETVVTNLNLLKKSFQEYDLETYLLTWNDELWQSIVKKNIFDNYFIFNEPKIEFIDTKINTRIKWQENLYDRHFKMFWSQKLFLDIIENSWRKYDFIIVSRPDLKIEITDAKKWLKKDTFNVPLLPNIDKDELFKKHGEIIVTDQFSIATQENMYKAWNFWSNEEFNELYKISTFAEQCFSRNIIKNWLKVNYIHEAYELNPKRNLKDKNYPFILRLRAGLKHYVLDIFILESIYKVFWKKAHNNIQKKLYKLFSKTVDPNPK